MDWDEKAKRAFEQYVNDWMTKHFPNAKPAAYENFAKSNQSVTALYIAGVRAGLEAAAKAIAGVTHGCESCQFVDAHIRKLMPKEG